MHVVCVCVYIYMCMSVHQVGHSMHLKVTRQPCSRVSPCLPTLFEIDLCCFSVRHASVKTPEDFAISASHLLLRESVLYKTAGSHVIHLVFMWF